MRSESEVPLKCEKPTLKIQEIPIIVTVTPAHKEREFVEVKNKGKINTQVII